MPVNDSTTPVLRTASQEAFCVLVHTVPLQCLWRDSVTLISTLLLTYLLLPVEKFSLCHFLSASNLFFTISIFSYKTSQVSKINTFDLWYLTSPSVGIFILLVLLWIMHKWCKNGLTQRSLISTWYRIQYIQNWLYSVRAACVLIISTFIQL